MEIQSEKIRDQQKSTWNDFSPMWKKWDDLLMKSLEPVGEEMIRLLDLKETDTVLDIASGTGEPGLSIAKCLKNGGIILTDLSENMLEIARDHATKKEIGNIETRVCDACELPFQDNTFNAVSCRLGFMFFPDMLEATKEMYRVLKPGGKIAASVWSVPESNFWATAISSTIAKNMQLSPAPPQAPGLFRCAESGLLPHLFQQAGFKNVTEKEVSVQLNFETVERYWTIITEVTPPLAAALNKADDAMKEKIKNEVYEVVNRKYPDGKVNIGGISLLISGEK
ncbi:class I SAM-dependent methyltransferase [Salinimicrobium xinjiangense]|uniref:class I SAM-dependent methyltransferase n=1 Tax=Salinimicrobium xinjiangense TaxID=438596 RepID=UPI0004066546|nr:class I SAM-dependent methyltransferase [Salinimicrobium xinjiangense]